MLVWTSLIVGAGLLSQGSPGPGAPALQGKPIARKIISASAVGEMLTKESNLRRVLQWENLYTLTPSRPSMPGVSMILYKPSCVDSTGVGLADIVGLPGGGITQPGEPQSYLWVRFPVTKANVLHGIAMEFTRYVEDTPSATFEVSFPNKKVTKTIQGPGVLTATFTPASTGPSGVFIQMTSPGRYLFSSITVKRAKP